MALPEVELIWKGSAVHCISAYEGDVLVLGSDGVFRGKLPLGCLAQCKH